MYQVPQEPISENVSEAGNLSTGCTETPAPAGDLASEALALFAAADKNGDGSLSRSELKKEIQKDEAVRARLGAESWGRFFDHLDSDGALLSGSLLVRSLLTSGGGRRWHYHVR